jgi:hypothetical protein
MRAMKASLNYDAKPDGQGLSCAGNRWDQQKGCLGERQREMRSIKRERLNGCKVKSPGFAGHCFARLAVGVSRILPAVFPVFWPLHCK